MPPKVSPRTVILDAIIEAAERGLTIAEIRAVSPTKGGWSMANTGRWVSQLTQDKLIEKADGGRWRSTEKGRTEGVRLYKRNGDAPPLLPRLPDAPPDAKPPQVKTGPAKAKVPIERVREAAAKFVENESFMTPDECAQMRQFIAIHGADDWRLWLPAMWPSRFHSPFGEHHAELWDWVWSIEANKAEVPFAAIWNRGSAKSMSSEGAVVALAARLRRRYALYVSGTQNLADEHVGNIGGMLAAPDFAAAYPAFAQREVGKYGESKGWRRNRLRTAAGFTVDALGLDVAARGARIDEQRPDLIVLDDVDSDNDTPHQTEKKIRAITRKLLPAGSQDVVVMFVQNMIHSQSIAARLAKMPAAPKADYLARRRVSGPIPALYDMTWKQVDDHYEITGGTPSWAGMPIEACQHMLDLFGLTGFLVECQHLESDLSGGMFDHLDFSPDSALVVTEAQVPRIRHLSIWVDPAVSATDRSDSCGIVVDGLGIDRRYYRLWSWERITTPTIALKTAIRTALEHATQYRPQTLTVGVETDQGGDTWEVVYRAALAELLDEDPELFENAPMLPRYEYAKAGATQLSKTERATRMQADYELGRFRHVQGRCSALEAGLHRFPRYKPYDCVDAAYWSWRWLAELGGENPNGKRVKTRARRGNVRDVTPANVG